MSFQLTKLAGALLMPLPLILGLLILGLVLLYLNRARRLSLVALTSGTLLLLLLSVPLLPRQAATAERMGFSGFWLPENHFSGSAALSAPLILLAGAAARTQSIDVGTTSLVLPIRHPVAVAEEVATLDQLAEGRLILGLGRGFSDDLFQVFSVDPSQKRAMFKQSLSTMISAWAGERLPGAGPRDIRLSPRPFQSPNPRLWIAAFGPLALKQAAAFGCPYLASPMESLSALQENRVRYHEALDAAEQAVAAGETARDAILTRVQHELAKAPLGEVEYAELRDPATLELAPERLETDTLLALAVFFRITTAAEAESGEAARVRLIDNRVLRVDPSQGQ